MSPQNNAVVAQLARAPDCGSGGHGFESHRRYFSFFMTPRKIIPRKIKGFRDISPEQNKVRWHIVSRASEVYKKYGYEHWDTPVLEYAECLGKYLPGEDAVADGIYSFPNPEEEAVTDEKGKPLRNAQNQVTHLHFPLALRYDLTAPLARLYAEDLWQRYLQKNLTEKNVPLLRRYQYGPVYRFEKKLDPGRFREFWQIDFDSVGTKSIYADAEACMILSDALENIGLEKGSYQIKINNRKLLKGFLAFSGATALTVQGLTGESLEQAILRILDKADKIGTQGVLQELAEGRKDSSGAFVEGLKLPEKVLDKIANFLITFEEIQGKEQTLQQLQALNISEKNYEEGLSELLEIAKILNSLHYSDTEITFSPTLVRGMGYYTGPIFEAVYKQEFKDSKGKKREVGSIAGGGRYDGLVANLLGIKVPAVGASIGVDRLAELLGERSFNENKKIFIVNFDNSLMPLYQKIARDLRAQDLVVEVFYGINTKLKKQMSYADRKNFDYAILIGEEEKNKGIATVKNLKAGKELKNIDNKEEWKKQVQREVSLEKLTEFFLGK